MIFLTYFLPLTVTSFTLVAFVDLPLETLESPPEPPTNQSITHILIILFLMQLNPHPKKKKKKFETNMKLNKC